MIEIVPWLLSLAYLIVGVMTLSLTIEAKGMNMLTALLIVLFWPFLIFLLSARSEIVLVWYYGKDSDQIQQILNRPH